MVAKTKEDKEYTDQMTKELKQDQRTKEAWSTSTNETVNLWRSNQKFTNETICQWAMKIRPKSTNETVQNLPIRPWKPTNKTHQQDHAKPTNETVQNPPTRPTKKIYQ